MNERKRAVAELSEMINGSTDSAVTNYVVDSGCSVGWGLYKDGRIAVQRNELSAGTIFPAHTHTDKAEWIIVYNGSIRFWYGDTDTVVLQVGDSLKLEPNVPHSAEVLELCHMIAITIPADEGYPDAPAR